MWVATARETRNTEPRLTAMTSSQVSSAHSSSGVRRWMPALLTRMSIGPILFSMRSTAASTARLSVTSKAESWAVNPASRSSATALSTPASRVPLTRTAAPASARPCTR